MLTTILYNFGIYAYMLGVLIASIFNRKDNQCKSKNKL